MSSMTLAQQIITIGMCILGTMATRYLPFFIFKENKKTPEYIQYLGKFLPSAVFGMLVIYCLKNVEEKYCTELMEFRKESPFLSQQYFIYGRKICFYPLQVELSVIC